MSRRVWAVLWIALASPAAHADVPAWIGVGLNFAHAEQADRNCGGGQAGFGFGGKLMLRAQYSVVSFEQEDDGKDCDAGLYGDSYASERAVMAGLASRGLFVAAGPAAVHVAETRYGPSGDDTGTRAELGFASRLTHGRVAGYELVLFHTDNEVRRHSGVQVSWTFGPSRRVQAPPARRGGRY